jgi:hypothetical protein
LVLKAKVRHDAKHFPSKGLGILGTLLLSCVLWERAYWRMVCQFLHFMESNDSININFYLIFFRDE